ncbi:MAG: hypothetical protein ACYC27_11890 [Armatimonadota bacterium]
MIHNKNHDASVAESGRTIVMADAAADAYMVSLYKIILSDSTDPLTLALSRKWAREI